MTGRTKINREHASTMTNAWTVWRVSVAGSVHDPNLP
jgi:hypothetical protein